MDYLLGFIPRDQKSVKALLTSSGSHPSRTLRGEHMTTGRGSGTFWTERSYRAQ